MHSLKGERWLFPPGSTGKFTSGKAWPQCKLAKKGYVDKSGKVVIKIELEEASIFNGGLARVIKGGKWGLVDRTGKMVLSGWDYIGEFTEGLATAKWRGPDQCYIDRTKAV